MAKYASVLFKSLFATLLRQSLKVHYKFCLYTFEDHFEAIRSYTWLVSLNREKVRHDLTKKSRRDLHHFYLEKCCHQAIEGEFYHIGHFDQEEKMRDQMG